MSFTKDEFESWHRVKLERENEPLPVRQVKPVTECVICNQPFGYGEGNVEGDIPMCALCLEKE